MYRHHEVRTLRTHHLCSLRFGMRILGRMVAAVEVPYAQLHTRRLQAFILACWNKNPLSLNRLVSLPTPVRRSLRWWISSLLVLQGHSILPIHWQVVTTDASLLGWGGVFHHQTIQGVWTPREARLPINILELRAIFRSLCHWRRLLEGLAVRIQTDNATAVAYIHRQGGTRS